MFIGVESIQRPEIFRNLSCLVPVHPGVPAQAEQRELQSAGVRPTTHLILLQRAQANQTAVPVETPEQRARV